jgi:hypothetical protein
MAHVISLFDTFDDAEKAVNMLVERQYPAENITVIAGESGGTHRELSGEEIAEDEDDGGLLDLGRLLRTGLFGDLLGRGGRERSDDELAQDLTEAGVWSDQIVPYSARIRQGGVLVAVETEDFRAEDVQNILDNAAGRDLERLLSEEPTDDGEQASAGGPGSASGFV